MNEIIAGIDLGTTNSVIAILGPDGAPKVIPIDGQLTLPSVVAIGQDGEILVGGAARNLLTASPERGVASIKRQMGRAVDVLLAGQTFSPEEISAHILRRLKSEAERELGVPVERAVITVPAYFDEAQRRATQAAGEQAGLEVVRLLNEPTAASLAYESGHEGNETLLVYDLGGGTFDTSIVMVEKGVVEVMASHGDTRLGGDDLDELLVRRAVDVFQREHQVFLSGNRAAMSRLNRAMEGAKRRLSDEAFTSVREEFLDGEHHLDFEISRAEYEEMIDATLRRTLDSIHRAMQDAKLAPGALDRVIMAGGSTRTPLIHELIENALGMRPEWAIDPDLIVAYGAAIQGGRMAGIDSKALLVDISNHTFGVASLQSIGFSSGLYFTPVLRRGTPLPASKSEVFLTSVDRQESVDVKIYEGESRELSENTFLGQFFITGLRRASAGDEVVAHFSLDLNGMLTVSATEKATGVRKSVTLNTRDASRNPVMGGKDDSTGDESSDFPVDAEPAQPSAVTTARTLESRAKKILQGELDADDRSEIEDLVKQSQEAIAQENHERLEELNASLEDSLFFLEE